MITVPVSSLKPLSKLIVSVLKLMLKHIRTYNNRYHAFSKTSSFRNVLKIDHVRNEMKTLNKRHEKDTIMAFGFFILYTKITHNKLLKELYELIYFYFDGSHNTFVTITKYKVKWVSGASTFLASFSKK